MIEDAQLSATEADWAEARQHVGSGVSGLFAALLGVLLISSIAAGVIAVSVVGDGNALVTVSMVGVVALVIGGPLIYGINVVIRRRGLGLAVEWVMHERLRAADTRRREFETKVARALEMSVDEVAAYDTIKRGTQLAIPGSPFELLLADNSQAHLSRVVSAPGDGVEAPRCSVSSPSECVAARRAHTHVFPDSEALDACPLLRNRGGDRCSAVCVPVSIMGRTVGVLHATGEADAPVDDDAVQSLQVLANQVGNRLGMLRIMAETQLQASTDPLTGLMNRRSLENRARLLGVGGVDFALVMADLDHFKSLNDSHGHETGDRALRVFAETLRASVRDEDLVCRYGGEEFVVLLPGVDLAEAVEVMERVREAVARVTRRGDVPTFTGSYGIAKSTVAVDFTDLMQRADRALFAAKDAGRDRICVDGQPIAVTPSLTAIN